jgi:hypothetical protein
MAHQVAILREGFMGSSALPRGRASRMGCVRLYAIPDA